MNSLCTFGTYAPTQLKSPPTIQQAHGREPAERPLSFGKLRTVSLAEPFAKEGREKPEMTHPVRRRAIIISEIFEIGSIPIGLLSDLIDLR